MGKYKFYELVRGLVPLTVFMSTQGDYLLKYLCFDWAEKVTGQDGLAIATGRKDLHISPALMALPGRPG